MADWLPEYIKSTYDSTHAVYLQQAYDYAKKHSDDIHTQVGSIIVSDDTVLARGANSMPPKIKKCPSRLIKPDKYMYIEHAERNCLFDLINSEYHLYSKHFMVMYAPWFSCAECSRAIILSGIKHIVGHYTPYYHTPPRWKSSILVGMGMMHEAGIKMEIYIGKVNSTMLLDEMIIEV